MWRLKALWSVAESGRLWVVTIAEPVATGTRSKGWCSWMVFLEHIQGLQRHAGVAKADREGDLLVQHEVFRGPATRIGISPGLALDWPWINPSVALDQLDRLTQVAADLVDFLDRELRAETRRCRNPSNPR